MTIIYLRGNKRVRQVLGAIPSWNLSGEFTKVFTSLQSEYEKYKVYLEEPHEMVVDGYSGYASYDCYLDGSKKKNVQFDKLWLEWQDVYEDEKELCVIGERNMDLSELAALAEEKNKQEEREKEQLLALMKKYPNV